MRVVLVTDARRILMLIPPSLSRSRCFLSLTLCLPTVVFGEIIGLKMFTVPCPNDFFEATLAGVLHADSDSVVLETFVFKIHF
jgi:hypothetical protein